MNLLRFAGVDTVEGKTASEVVDKTLRELVDRAAAAHDQLRAGLQDPGFASIICKALGCEKGACASESTSETLRRRSTQVPHVVNKITSAG